MQKIKEYVNAHIGELYVLLKDLCLIPAPSHHEEKRAEYCKKWFDENCGAGAYIDEALNVIFPYGVTSEKKALSVLAAHTDTVFPDLEPMPYEEKEGKIYCPGVGDDTASLAIMMLCAKYICENKLPTENGILFVANSCEEGLGNLKGTRRLFSDLDGRIARFVSFDGSSFDCLVDRSVGSHRYLVTARTEGGHSFGRFGNRNAIAVLAEMITEIYEIEVPKKEGTKTTYNVGTVEGGTSVNTIAQEAKMLCEYRSDDMGSMAYMKKCYEQIFKKERKDATVEVEMVGDRPCMGDVDPDALSALRALCIDATVKTLGGEAPVSRSGSTDANIPHSLGIPAITMAVWLGGGAHTREEWISKDSLTPGFEIGLRTAIDLL